VQVLQSDVQDVTQIAKLTQHAVDGIRPVFGNMRDSISTIETKTTDILHLTSSTHGIISTTFPEVQMNMQTIRIGTRDALYKINMLQDTMNFMQQTTNQDQVKLDGVCQGFNRIVELVEKNADTHLHQDGRLTDLVDKVVDIASHVSNTSRTRDVKILQRNLQDLSLDVKAIEKILRQGINLEDNVAKYQYQISMSIRKLQNASNTQFGKDILQGIEAKTFLKSLKAVVSIMQDVTSSQQVASIDNIKMSADIDQDLQIIADTLSMSRTISLQRHKSPRSSLTVKEIGFAIFPPS